MRSKTFLLTCITFAFLMVFFGCSGAKKAVSAIQNGDYSSAAEAYHKSNDADEKKQIRKAAEEALSSAVSEYNNGELAYEDATDILEEIKDTGIVSSSKIETTKETLDELEWSKQAFQIAEDYLNKKDYISAMSFFSIVDPNDTLYTKAQEQFANARSMYIEEAKQTAAEAAAQQDYEKALQVLSVCTENIGTVEEIEVLMRKYETDSLNKTIENTLEKAKTYIASGDYHNAYKMLVDASKTYPNRVEIETALINCKRDYISYALQQAESVFTAKKDYNGAISILSLAMVDLPEDPELQAAIDRYTAYRPVELKELDYFHYEKTWLQYSKNTIKTNTGEEYSGFYYSGGWGGSGKTTYLINGKFDVISGIVFTDFYARNYNSGELKIYGDGKLLFESGKMSVGAKPIEFQIKITGIAQIEFEYIGGDSHDMVCETPTLANVWLKKSLEN